VKIGKKYAEKIGSGEKAGDQVYSSIMRKTNYPLVARKLV
jgi:hypothetical protein